MSKQKHDLWNRIITTRKNICQQLMIYDSKITKRTVFCLAKGPEHPKYELVLYDICSSLCWINKLMYNSDGEMKKLSAQQYKQKAIYIFCSCESCRRGIDDSRHPEHGALLHPAESMLQNHAEKDENHPLCLGQRFDPMI